MAARDEAHRTAGPGMRVDRQAGLDIAGAEIAVMRVGFAEARILVPGEIAHRPRRLPVKLVDDLFQVAADQRFEDSKPAWVAAHIVHHADQRRSVGVRRDVVEKVAVAEAAAVRDPLGMHCVHRRTDRLDLCRRKHALHDGIAVFAIGGDVVHPQAPAAVSRSS